MNTNYEIPIEGIYTLAEVYRVQKFQEWLDIIRNVVLQHLVLDTYVNLSEFTRFPFSIVYISFLSTF